MLIILSRVCRKICVLGVGVYYLTALELSHRLNLGNWPGKGRTCSSFGWCWAPKRSKWLVRVIIAILRNVFLSRSHHRFDSHFLTFSFNFQEMCDTCYMQLCVIIRRRWFHTCTASNHFLFRQIRKRAQFVTRKVCILQVFFFLDIPSCLLFV